jgi:hypothetical protein
VRLGSPVVTSAEGTHVAATVLLFVISAGLPTTNAPGGRPNLTAATDAVARRAAAANVQLYVFYLNVHFLQHFSVATGWRSPSALYQDIDLFGSGLQRFADSAGGAFFQVEVDSDPFVDRAFRETSAFYRLAVRPDPADADGKPRPIRVTVKRSGVTLRYRRIVTIPLSIKTDPGGCCHRAPDSRLTSRFRVFRSLVSLRER